MRKITARHQVYVARIGFILCGFVIACWAPLIPILQKVLVLDTIKITTILFSFGFGSILGMLLSGIMIEKCGFKFTYALMSLICSASICIVALMPNYEIVLASVVIFGASYSCLEVALNVFSSYLEKRFRVMLLSVLYAYYSLGEVVGAILMILLLALAIPPVISITTLIAILYFSSAYYIPVIMSIKSQDKKANRAFSRPRQPVIFFGLIVAFTYMVGGAILDWSGLYLTQEQNVPLEYANYGFALVAFCMLMCRLFSRQIIAKLGAIRVALGGAILMSIGLFTLVLLPNIITMTISFLAIGIGMSNITPLVTSAAGQQDKMPLVSAVAFVSILGYTGLLFGPALLGLIANTFSIREIFIFLAILTIFSATLIYATRKPIIAIDRSKKD